MQFIINLHFMSYPFFTVTILFFYSSTLSTLSIWLLSWVESIIDVLRHQNRMHSTLLPEFHNDIISWMQSQHPLHGIIFMVHIKPLLSIGNALATYIDLALLEDISKGNSSIPSEQDHPMDLHPFSSFLYDRQLLSTVDRCNLNSSKIEF